MDSPRPQVVHASDVEEEGVAGPIAQVTTLIDDAVGSEQLVQRAYRLPAGTSVHLGHPDGEDVVYVARGSGRLWKGEQTHEVGPGAAAAVPRGAVALLTNLGAGEMVVVSVLSPPPSAEVRYAEIRDAPLAVLHEDEQEDLPAGPDRHFRILMEPRHGALNVTQFVGYIERSRAPFHTHTYEEAIYILDGGGVVHIDESETPIRAGTSIFLPPGTPHCLENRSDGVLKLLGVFSPPGSPAGMMEA